MSKLYGGCNNNFHAQLPIMKKARNKIPSLFFKAHNEILDT